MKNKKFIIFLMFVFLLLIFVYFFIKYNYKQSKTDDIIIEKTEIKNIENTDTNKQNISTWTSDTVITGQTQNQPEENITDFINDQLEWSWNDISSWSDSDDTLLQSTWSLNSTWIDPELETMLKSLLDE